MRGVSGALDALSVLDANFFQERPWMYKHLLGAPICVGESAEGSVPNG